MKKVFISCDYVYIHVCDVEQDHNQIFSLKSDDLTIFIVDSEQQFLDLDKKLCEAFQNTYIEQSEFACQKQFYDSEELYEERRKEVLTFHKEDFDKRFDKELYFEIDVETFNIKQ